MATIEIQHEDAIGLKLIFAGDHEWLVTSDPAELEGGSARRRLSCMSGRH